jgi:RHS repeat-associated protein
LINYSYDNNGNLTSKTDARQITTNYVYDNLNRVKNRNYSDNTTPNVAYTYDNLTNAKGKLIKVANGTSTTEYLNFDILGRVQNHKQTTDGNVYNSSYVYNLSGALIEEVYPSGRVVKNTLDIDGDLQQVQSRKSNGTFQNYANAFTYTSAGAVSSMRLGNGKFENTTFNSRLQPTQIGLGSSATSQNLLKLNFDYGSVDNNGNVKSQTITTPTVGTATGFTAIQNYTYDSLNRIKQAEETIPSQTGWKQTFKYDRYGNREFDTQNNNTTTLANGCPVAVCNPQASPTNNKLVGTTYDDAGNTKIDASNQSYVYDAENKMVKAKNASGVTLGEYFYDGDGQRVKKFVPSTNETTIFVYDASGKMVAEYSTVTASQSEAKISYLTNDHLGSPRITTDAMGKVVSRRDFMPFGEEIARANYGSDSVRQKFTGYERDGETGLDYAQARMFGSGVGRFTSPDPLLSSGRIENPKTWNRYAYVLGNPLKYSDPLGLYDWDVSAGGSSTDDELLARSQDKNLKKNERKTAKNQLTFRQNFRNGLQAAKDLANNSKSGLTNQQQGRVQRAVNSYGDFQDGTHDNVKVGTRLNPKSGDAVNSNPSTNLDTEEGHINVLFNFNRAADKNSNGFVIDITHEGSHTADFTDWAVNSGTSEASQSDITNFETERRAYLVGSYTAQALGMDSYNKTFGKDDRTWKKGWSEAERNTAIGGFIRGHYTNMNGDSLTENNSWTMSTRGH